VASSFFRPSLPRIGRPGLVCVTLALLAVPARGAPADISGNTLKKVVEFLELFRANASFHISRVRYRSCVLPAVRLLGVGLAGAAV
jgi:hypothetical protein